jgi:hypothetical protein
MGGLGLGGGGSRETADGEAAAPAWGGADHLVVMVHGIVGRYAIYLFEAIHFASRLISLLSSAKITVPFPAASRTLGEFLIRLIVTWMELKFFLERHAGCK